MSWPRLASPHSSRMHSPHSSTCTGMYSVFWRQWSKSGARVEQHAQQHAEQHAQLLAQLLAHLLATLHPSAKLHPSTHVSTGQTKRRADVKCGLTCRRQETCRSRKWAGMLMVWRLMVWRRDQRGESDQASSDQASSSGDETNEASRLETRDQRGQFVSPLHSPAS